MPQKRPPGEARFIQNGQTVLLGVAAVDDHPLAQLQSQIQLPPEPLPLDGAGRKIVKIVEPDLAHGLKPRIRPEGPAHGLQIRSSHG